MRDPPVLSTGEFEVTLQKGGSVFVDNSVGRGRGAGCALMSCMPVLVWP